jgi:hypothetical protein
LGTENICSENLTGTYEEEKHYKTMKHGKIIMESTEEEEM